LISNDSPQLTEQSFAQFQGGADDYRGFTKFYELVSRFAELSWPTLLEPLASRADMKAKFKTDDEKAAWEMLVEQPIGAGIEEFVQHDLVRGVILTDAKIGVFTYPNDPSLLQNRTFVYHVIGNGTGEWAVPVGGMGALTGELARVAQTNGAEFLTSATVGRIEPDSPYATVYYSHQDMAHTVQAKYVLVNAAPQVLNQLLPAPLPIDDADEGSVFKINMLLKRLPKLKAGGYSPKEAFTGTFHIDEGYAAMQESYQAAASGNIPNPTPGEMYCHSLTDSSILSNELSGQGYQTLTLFGLDIPYRLFNPENNEQVREAVLQKYLQGLNRYLDEPIEECLAVDANGKLCIEAKSPLDLENELKLPTGNIFHTALSWPFAENDSEWVGKWGVETAYENIFICGSGAQRGGAVSGIPGHNAAMKVMELIRAAR
jgi:phytoene dehydrogenase-like protein